MKKISRNCTRMLWLLIIFLVGCTSVQTAEIYDEFTSKLTEEQYYVFVEVEDFSYPVLFVTDNVYEYEEGVWAAVSGEVYYVQDDKVVSIGEISSEGTAYPICFSDKGVYTAGHHYVSKYNVDENTMNLLLEEYAEEVFEEGTGKETYFYTINGVTETVENRQKLEMLFEQYEAAEVLNFQRWQK